jgi:spoIIIJ-associated protein
VDDEPVAVGADASRAAGSARSRGAASPATDNGGEPDERAEPAESPTAESRTADETDETPRPKGAPMSSDLVSMEEQADIIESFLEGLTEAFGVQPEIRREVVDDEMLELQVQAPDLGLLIGPKGQTLAAVQELARTVLQRKATGTYEGRVRIDIAGYRSRRREALERFATGVADQVRASGKPKVLEPMSPPDRKVVHDTVNELDGVATASEGTEPYRRVVIKPA